MDFVKLLRLFTLYYTVVCFAITTVQHLEAMKKNDLRMKLVVLW